MKINYLFHDRKYIYVLITILFVLYSLLMFYFNSEFIDRINLTKNTKITEYSNQIDSFITLNQKLADVFFEGLIEKNPDILRLMAMANDSDKSEKDKYREKLAAIVAPIFINNIQDEFFHLHFYLANSESFYCVNKLDDQGGVLMEEPVVEGFLENRFVLANGFQQDNISSGYRFVYPLIDKGELVGSVELSISMSTLISIINQSFSYNGFFIVKKDVIYHNVDPKIISLKYIDSPIFDGYLIDKDVFENDENNNLVNYEVGVFDDLLKQEEDFISLNGVNYFYKNHIFISVKNYSGDHIGYLVFSETNDEIVNLTNDRILFMFIMGCFWLLVLLMILYLLISRYRTYETSLIDYLTGVNNYKGFNIKAKLLFENAVRNGHFWICFIDIDNFKFINDTYGHSKGDLILVDFAKILSESFRKSDVIGRFGGDEFVVCGICKEDDCGDLMFKKIDEKVQDYNSQDQNEIKIKFSFGYSQANEYDGIIFEELLSDADQRMYDMKKSKR